MEKLPRKASAFEKLAPPQSRQKNHKIAALGPVVNPGSSRIALRFCNGYMRQSSSHRKQPTEATQSLLRSNCLHWGSTSASKARLETSGRSAFLSSFITTAVPASKPPTWLALHSAVGTSLISALTDTKGIP